MITTLVTFLGFILGGASRLGVPTVKVILDYIKNRQEIKKLELMQNTQSSSCSCECKYIPSDSKVKNLSQSIEKKEPKRFNFIIAIFCLACIGISINVFLSIRYYSDLNAINLKLQELSTHCYFVAEYIISWIITGQAIEYKKK